MATDAEKAKVRHRARHRCEYCRAPEDITGYAFHIEHIQPRESGGKDEMNNYALCCMPCNRAKWYHVAGEDPKTGKSVRLFHPRKDIWSDHFRIDGEIQIAGKTSIGRATENRLQMNQPRQLEARELWVALERYP